MTVVYSLIGLQFVLFGAILAAFIRMEMMHSRRMRALKGMIDGLEAMIDNVNDGLETIEDTVDRIRQQGA